jgi:hypothetical protein
MAVKTSSLMFATVINKEQFDFRSYFPLFVTIYLAEHRLSRISTAVGAMGVSFQQEYFEIVASFT